MTPHLRIIPDFCGQFFLQEVFREMSWTMAAINPHVANIRKDGQW